MLSPFENILTESMVFDAIKTGLIVLNQKCEVVTWNQWMVEHSFIQGDMALGKPLVMVFPDMGARLQMAINDALSLRLSAVVSSRLNATLLPLYRSMEDYHQNHRINQSFTVSPITHHHQKWCLLQITDNTQGDLHEQSTVEQEFMAARAQEQEFQLKTILDNTLDAIIILNRLGRINGFYRSAQKMFGYSQYELLGKPLTVLLPPPCDRRFESVIEQARTNNSLSLLEQTKSIRSNGEVFHSDIAINTIFAGEDLQFIVTIKDITERHLAQEALYREKEQAQVTLSSIADGVITTDIVGRINFVNPAALKLTGYTQEELLGHKIDRVIAIQSDRKKLPVFDCIQSGLQVDSVSGDILIHKMGKEIVIHQVATPIHNLLGDTIGAVMIFRDVSQSHRMASRLSWQASHDDLTQLINRREFERQLESVIEAARHENSEHCLVFLDLDKFKVVNDTCGHAAGDELLRQISDIFQSKIRGADTLARLGGDEFAIILNRCQVSNAVDVAESIRQGVDDFRYGWADQSFQVGVSIGLVMINAQSPEVEEVFQAADSACYAAKDAGRNRLHIYSPDDEEISLRRGEMQWLVHIQNAMDHDRFELNFQPIVPVFSNSDEHIHYEILLRMINEKGERIPPGAFLPSAERFQMMDKIDIWVVEHVFEWLDKYWDFNASDVFAINLSGQSMADEKLLYRVKKLLDQYSIPPSRICFEITETAAIRNLAKAQLFIEELKLLGCQFALDDFGSGLSSFAYLKSLDVDYLKIDGAFVKDMVEDPIDRAMVESIHNIGSVLKLKTIAEFVENDAIIEALKEVGVHYAQGYGIARPRPLPIDGSILFPKPVI